MSKQRIKKLIEISKDVIADGSLENGAIVAANSDKPTYPSTVQEYRYVWVRDAAYVCMAADLLELQDIPAKFFDWCLHRAEDFRERGFFYNAYNVNGTLHGTLLPPHDVKLSKSMSERCIHPVPSGTQFQPDQSGSLLLAIAHHIDHFNANVSQFKKLIEVTASGLCHSWAEDRFILPSYDLWEERCILPKEKGYHTYSLAICIAGIRTAMKLLGKKKKWVQTEKEMSNVFEEIYTRSSGILPRTCRKGRSADKTKEEDVRSDASLLGLVYPSGMLDPADEKMKRTVHEITEMNRVGKGGLLRYPGDIYCGGVRKGWVTLTGGGAWPLLSFWMSIYYCLCGDKKNAKRYFDWPLDQIDGYIPEQIFKDKKKQSISPLIWSHAMFVIAAKFLGHL
jgi:GH15 family glucan-1,4-alpha-glucosidase